MRITLELGTHEITATVEQAEEGKTFVRLSFTWHESVRVSTMNLSLLDLAKLEAEFEVESESYIVCERDFIKSLGFKPIPFGA